MGLIGRYIRTKLEDSPIFKELAKEDNAVKAPVSSLFKNHWRQLIQAVGAVLLNAVGFYVILSYMPTHLSMKTSGWPKPRPTSPPPWHWPPTSASSS